MKCPTCGQNSPDSWRWLVRKEPDPKGGTILHASGEVSARELEFGELAGPKKRSWVSLDWMRCANTDCDELIIRIHEMSMNFHGGPAPIQTTDAWIARPRVGATRPIDASVPERYRRDFAEAADIANRSPRMSAVLSRRILADLLEEFAGKAQYGLADRIDSFNDEQRHPYELRKNLHYLREIADMSAHTMKNDQARIIEVDAAEAEWTLGVVERLFDYFIVSPTRDRTMRASLDVKLADAKRRPIKPLPDDREP